MFEDLREQALSNSYFQESKEKPRRVERHKDTGPGFLGLTPFQRFFLALLLFLMTFLFSTFCLLVSGRIMPPFPA
jgi:hypothetical protein